MDKNTIIGFILMALVVFGFMWLNKPSEEERQAKLAEKEQQEKHEAEEAERLKQEAETLHPFTADERANIVHQIAAASTTDANGAKHFTSANVDITANDTAVTGSVYAANQWIPIDHVIYNHADSIYGRATAKAAETNLRTALTDAQANGPMGRHLTGVDSVYYLGTKDSQLQVAISTHGGAVVGTILNDYNSEVGGNQPVKPLTGGNGTYNFTLKTASNKFNTADLYFTPYPIDENTLEMRLTFDDETYWGFRYTLRPDKYIVGIEIIQNGMSRILGNNMNTIDMDWNQRMVRNEVGKTFEERNSGIYYKYVGDTPDYLSETSDDSKDLKENVKWIAFKNQFFSAVMIPRTSFNTAELSSKIIANDTYLKSMKMHATVDYKSDAAVPAAFDFYVGPNLYPLLSSLDDEIKTDEDLQLTRLIPLGWSLFRWINTLIIIPVFTFLGSFITNYGIVILLLTIFIKIILFPFTYKSYISQAKMRLLAPEIKEINDKYPGNENAMRRQQETMALYSRAGASPMAGCLPMLLQMPVLIAMFTFFPSCIELRGESFLWAHDLSAPDYICTLPFSIPWYGNRVSLFCLLMTVTNIIYTRINMQNQPSQSSMPGMKWLMYLMPVMFLFFFNDYASGLSYYYFLSLLLTIIQTWIFRRCVNEDKVRAEMAANAAKPKKKSGFMARLEEAQRKQQAMLREQQKRQGRK